MNQSRERFAKTISKCHVVLFCSHNWLLRGSFHFLFVNLAASSCVVLRMQPFTLSAKMFRATLVFVHKHTSRAAEMSTCVCVCVCVCRNLCEVPTITQSMELAAFVATTPAIRCKIGGELDFDQASQMCLSSLLSWFHAIRHSILLTLDSIGDHPLFRMQKVQGRQRLRLRAPFGGSSTSFGLR